MKYVVWNTAIISRMNEFGTKEEAQAYCQDKNEKCRALRGDDEDRFVCGTAAAYEKVYAKRMAELEAEAKAEAERIRQGFGKKLDEQIARYNACIAALESLESVCLKFDGKVINKRFKDAAADAMGEHWSLSLGEAYGPKFKIENYDYKYNSSNRPYVALWESDGWRWITGSRLEADEAIKLLRREVESLHGRIEKVESQRGQYDEYLEKVRQAEAIIKDLNGYGYELRDYCKDNVLRGVNANNIWKY